MAIAGAKAPLHIRPPLFLCAACAPRRRCATLAVGTLEGRRTDQQPAPPVVNKKSKNEIFQLKFLFSVDLVLFMCR